MAVPLTPEAIAFLNEKVIAHVATLMKDGSPQVTPVWVETDGTHILVNTSNDRLKWRNLTRDPRIALSIMGESSRRTMTVRGRVVDITTEGAIDQINRLSLKYTGNPQYQGFRDGSERVLVRIEPLSFRARV
jgi:PPOX class probable F420-dependent enzyme